MPSRGYELGRAHGLRKLPTPPKKIKIMLDRRAKAWYNKDIEKERGKQNE